MHNFLHLSTAIHILHIPSFDVYGKIRVLLFNKKIMFGLGPKELVILAGILILLFGSKKIADLARSVAEAVKILRDSFSDDKNQSDKK